MRSRSFPLLAVSMAVACLVSMPSLGNAAQAPEPPSHEPELLSAEVTIERRIIGPDGEVVHELPSVSYRIDRSHA
ncbi:MAG: hypothetical protein LC791_06450, partial [Acidobacteria bacterium]|nr:hypothetical protein [Acidobacteriota bacterium]